MIKKSGHLQQSGLHAPW